MENTNIKGVNKTKKPLSKSAKKIIIAVSIIAVVIILLIASVVSLSSSKSNLYNKVVISLMPKSISGNIGGNEMTFYVKSNKNYDAKKDEPLDAYEFYYYDGDNNKIDVPQGMYKTATEDVQVSVGFMMKAQQNANKVKSALAVVMVIFILAVIGLLILLWYKVWSKKYDSHKEIVSNKNNNDKE